MTADPRDLLAADEPLDTLPPGFALRVRDGALARRRRRRSVAGAGTALLLAGAVFAVPWATGGEQSLAPAPPAAPPSGRPEARPALEVPPCVHPDGYGRIAGTPGRVREAEPVQDSVQEDVSGTPGYLPEVEQALVDTAPPVARVDCASGGTVVFLLGDDGSYAEIRTGLSNPLHSREEYFARDDVETYRTPGGARVRLDASQPQLAGVELWAGRYDVSILVRRGRGGSAGLPLAETRAWADRLGDRLVEESDRRGEVRVEMLDRTPNPPPQEAVDALLAAAPAGAVRLPPDRASASQAERVAVVLPDGRSLVFGMVASTTNPRQTSPLTEQGLRDLGARLEGEAEGWPPGVLVGVIDLHRQFLVQYRDEVFVNLSSDDPAVPSERVRQWAQDVVAALG